MFDLRLILEGYYTFGEIFFFFLRVWIITLVVVFTAAIFKYHEFILSVVGQNMMGFLDAIGPIIIILIGLRILFRAIFR